MHIAIEGLRKNCNEFLAHLGRRMVMLLYKVSRFTNSNLIGII